MWTNPPHRSQRRHNTTWDIVRMVEWPAYNKYYFVGPPPPPGNYTRAVSESSVGTGWDERLKLGCCQVSKAEMSRDGGRAFHTHLNMRNTESSSYSDKKDFYFLLSLHWFIFSIDETGYLTAPGTSSWAPGSISCLGVLSCGKLYFFPEESDRKLYWREGRGVKVRSPGAEGMKHRETGEEGQGS